MRTPSLVLATTLSACGTPDTTLRSASYDPSAFTRLSLRVDAGSVSIRPTEATDDTPDPEATIEADLTWRGDVAPVLETRLAGGTLLVSVTCPTGARACSAAVDVRLPATTEIDLTLDAGDVTLVALDGLLDVVIGSGSAALERTTGSARVSVNAGTIRLTEVSGRFDIETVTGDIEVREASAPIAEARTERGGLDLRFLAAPDLADLSSTSGDVRIEVPAGDYDVDATSRRGDVSIEGITNTSNAPSVILARAISGDIEIRGD